LKGISFEVLEAFLFPDVITQTPKIPLSEVPFSVSHGDDREKMYLIGMGYPKERGTYKETRNNEQREARHYAHHPKRKKRIFLLRSAACPAFGTQVLTFVL
jgi:hypothetical protein